MKYEKIPKVDLKVFDKVVESDRPKNGLWQSYEDVCFFFILDKTQIHGRNAGDFHLYIIFLKKNPKLLFIL